MTRNEIAGRRLRSNHLVGPRFEQPAGVVQWLGAVQAQDYGGAKWAIGQRAKSATDAELDQLFDAGVILRTHILRPTWHFVTPADIRWMLALTGPRVNTANTHMYGQCELTSSVFAQTNAILEKALANGTRLTRPEIAGVLGDHGIEAGGVRLAYIVMRAELDAVICSGGLRGKQFTYAMLGRADADAARQEWNLLPKPDPSRVI